MASSDIYISLTGVGQWLPIAPVGAVIIYDRGEQYGTSYEINCVTGDIHYTPGAIDEFRYIIVSCNVYGGGDAPACKQNNAVWGPFEKFPVISLGEGTGQGLRNTSYLTKNPFYFCDQYKDYTSGSKVSLWKQLDEFNHGWTPWNDWFIPSKDELMLLVNQTTTAGGSNTFGFITPGWVQTSNEYSGNTTQCSDNAYLVGGNVGEGADKSSTSYGRLYYRYIGGQGYEGITSSTPLPSGVTGSIPTGYESLWFKRLLNQGGGNTFTWGFDGRFFCQEIAAFDVGYGSVAIGEGAKTSLYMLLSAGVSMDSDVLTTTSSIAENLFLFVNRFSNSQVNSFGNLPLGKVGLSGSTPTGAYMLPFIPSKDELVIILNNSRGKGIFSEGEEFWSSTDTSTTQAYSVVYHENSEPTANNGTLKTTALKTLVCYWKRSWSILPKVDDPSISVTKNYAVTAKSVTTQGSLSMNPSYAPVGGSVTITATPKPGYALSSATAVTESGTAVTPTLSGNNITVPISTAENVAASVFFTATSSFTVSLNTPSNGTLTANKTSAAIGDIITLSITPASGYSLGSLLIKNASTQADIPFTSITSGAFFIMPAANVSVEVEFSASVPCLDADASVTLADGTEKKFRDLKDDDLLLVWNFDKGCYDTAPLLWRLSAQWTDKYWLLETDSGRTIKVIGNHRFFSLNTGKFERTTDLLGHKVQTLDGPETVVSCVLIEKPIEYCNAISFYHMNVIVGGFFTSCGFNNLYPIKDMKYQYDSIRTRGTDKTYWTDKGVSESWFEGMRIDEQYSPDEEIVSYVKYRSV